MPLKGGVGDGGAAVAVGVAGMATAAAAAGLPTCKTAAQNKPMGGSNVSMSPISRREIIIVSSTTLGSGIARHRWLSSRNWHGKVTVLPKRRSIKITVCYSFLDSYVTGGEMAASICFTMSMWRASRGVACGVMDRLGGTWKEARVHVMWWMGFIGKVRRQETPNDQKPPISIPRILFLAFTSHKQMGKKKGAKKRKRKQKTKAKEGEEERERETGDLGSREGGAVGEDDPAGLAGEGGDDLVDVGADAEVVVAVAAEARKDPAGDRAPVPLPQLGTLLLLRRPAPP